MDTTAIVEMDITTITDNTPVTLNKQEIIAGSCDVVTCWMKNVRHMCCYVQKDPIILIVYTYYEHNERIVFRPTFSCEAIKQYRNVLKST